MAAQAARVRRKACVREMTATSASNDTGTESGLHRPTQFFHRESTARASDGAVNSLKVASLAVQGYSTEIMNVTTAIPDDLSLQMGERIQFQAVVKQDGSFLVTRVLRRETPKTADEKPRMTLGGWARKWGGTFKLEKGETFESLRDAYLKKKYGL